MAKPDPLRTALFEQVAQVGGDLLRVATAALANAPAAGEHPVMDAIYAARARLDGIYPLLTAVNAALANGGTPTGPFVPLPKAQREALVAAAAALTDPS